VDGEEDNIVVIKKYVDPSTYWLVNEKREIVKKPKDDIQSIASVRTDKRS